MIYSFCTERKESVRARNVSCSVNVACLTLSMYIYFNPLYTYMYDTIVPFCSCRWRIETIWGQSVLHNHTYKILNMYNTRATRYLHFAHLATFCFLLPLVCTIHTIKFTIAWFLTKASVLPTCFDFLCALPSHSALLYSVHIYLYI